MNNILLVSPSFPPYTSGAATYFSNLSISISNINEYKCFVLTTYNKNKKIISNEGEIKIYRFIPNLIESPFILRILVLPIITFISALFIRVIHEVKVIHVHSSSAITLGISLLSFIIRIPIILDVQDLMVNKLVVKFGKVKSFIATGENIKKLLMKFGVEDNQILVVNSIPPVISENNVNFNSKNINNIVFVGSLNYKIKGLDNLLFAIKDLVQKLGKKVSLTIIGTGINEVECKTFIKVNNLENNIKMLGSLTNKNTQKEILKAGMLVLPSLTEGIPRVIIESFSMKTLVIASNVGGIPEIIKDSENGYLIEPGSKDSIIDIVKRILDNQVEIDNVINRAFEYVQKLESWETMTSKIINRYN